MPSANFTEMYLQSLRKKLPENGRIEIFDTEERGHFLRLSSTGSMVFYFRYNTNEFDGRGRRRKANLRLGPYRQVRSENGALSLSESRAMAQQARGSVARGEDPAKEIQDNRRVAKEAGRVKNAVSVAHAIEEFISVDAASASKWKTRERPRILRKELSEPFGNRGIGEVDFKTLQARQNKIRRRPAPISANRFAEAARAFFKWAAPQYGIENPTHKLGRVVNEEDYERDRYLTIDELRTVWGACGSLSQVSCDVIRVLMLTPQRIDAVLNMRFDQIDADGVWHIPRHQKKQKLTVQSLPLSNAALEIIETRKPDGVESPKSLVFTSGRVGDKPLQATSKIKERLDRLCGSEMEHWRFHDFRRSFETWAASQGVSREVVKKILDQFQKRRDRLDRIYNQYQYRDEQRTALNAYAEAIRG